MKTYTIAKTRRGRTTEKTGTLEELKEFYSYTLECGHSWNPKINKNPKTIKSLMTAIEKSVQELQGGNFDQDFYELVK